MLAAEAAHRDHAIVEQVIAELKAGPLAHLPSGTFTANAAWLVLAAIAVNLTRAAGALAGALHAKARTATGVGLEVQRGHVVEHQRRRPQRRMLRARGGQ